MNRIRYPEMIPDQRPPVARAGTRAAAAEPMQPAHVPTPRNPTRLGYRIAAGVLGLFILAVGLPAAVLHLADGGWLAWLLAAGCLVGGGGLVLGAYTGRWYHAR